MDSLAGWLIPPQSLSGWLADSAAVAGWLNPPRARNAPPMIMYDWNDRINAFSNLHGINLWSERCAHYFSSLKDHRWVRHLMQWHQWQVDGGGRGGRPAYLWHTVLTNFCRWKGLPLAKGVKKSRTLDGTTDWFFVIY